jgi:hypothetical protein
LKSLSTSICRKSGKDIANKDLTLFRANNPDVQFSYIRTHVLEDPFVVGVYNYNRQKKHRCSWKTAEQVLAMVEEMAIGGDYRSGRKRGIRTRVPRGLVLFDNETMGHDVFQVHSKYKGDPPPRDFIKSCQHPHYTHKVMS